MKLCHLTWHKVGIITYIQHLEDTAPLKFGKAKNVQNSARFMTTFNFDANIWRTGKYIKSNKQTLLKAIPAALNKKIGELLCTLFKSYSLMLTYPKSTVRAILNNFRVWSQISPERIKTSTIGNKLDWLPYLPCWTEKLVNFGPPSKKWQTQLLTHPKSTVRAILDNLKIWLPYLRNGPKGQQLETNLIDRHHSRVWRKKLVNFSPLTKKL